MPDCIYVNYNHFADEVGPGKKILIDDGDIEFEVIEKNGDALCCARPTMTAL